MANHDNDGETAKLAINEDLERTTRSTSFITCTLTSSSPSSIEKHNVNESETSGRKINDVDVVEKGQLTKREKLQKEWDETCKKWGFVVVRQLTYEQNAVSTIDEGIVLDNSARASTSANATGMNSGNTHDNVRNAPVIMVNGIEALQIRDELVVSSVVGSSPAHSAGIREGDTIDALYGMKYPSLSLLFGIMRDSNTFQVTIKRMETQYERNLRNGIVTQPARASQERSGRISNEILEDSTKMVISGEILEGSKDDDTSSNMEVMDDTIPEKDLSSKKDLIQKEGSGCDIDQEQSQTREVDSPNDQPGIQDSRLSLSKNVDNDQGNMTSKPIDESVDTEFDSISFDEDAFAAMDAAVLVVQASATSPMNQKKPNDSPSLGKLPNDSINKTSQKIDASNRVIEQDDSDYEDLFGDSSADEQEIGKDIAIESVDGGNETHPEISDGNRSIQLKNVQHHNHENAEGGDETHPEIPDENVIGLLKNVQQHNHENADGGDETHPEISDGKRNAQLKNVQQHNHENADGGDETNPKIPDENGNGLLQKIQQSTDENADDDNETNPEIPDGNGNIRKKAQQSTDENADGGNETNPEIPDGNENNLQKKAQDNTDRESGKTYTENSASTSNESAEKNDRGQDLSNNLSSSQRISTSDNECQSILEENCDNLLDDTELFEAEEKLFSMIENSMAETDTTYDDLKGKNKSKSGKDRELNEDQTKKSTSKKKQKKKSKRDRKRTLSEDSNRIGSEEVTKDKRKRKHNKIDHVTEEQSQHGKNASAYKSASNEAVHGQKRIDNIASASSAPLEELSFGEPLDDQEMMYRDSVEGNNSSGRPPRDTGRKTKGNATEANGNRPRDRSFSVSSQPSPLTIPRSSPVTVSRQGDTTTVTSTSSKTGLTSKRSTKLKRLWPDTSLFSKRIMKWYPPQVVRDDAGVYFKGPVASGGVTKAPLPVIPQILKDTSEIIKVMSPHILEEGLLSLRQEFTSNSNRQAIWTRETITMYLRSCIPVDPRSNSTSTSVRSYEFAFSLDPKNASQPAMNLGEIFVVHSPAWKKQTCCIGIILSNDINSTFLADQRLDDDDSHDWFKLWMCVCSEPKEKTGWLPEADMPPKNPDGTHAVQTMYALNIGTCTDMMRQYEGLKSLNCIGSHLKKAIFCRDIIEPSGEDPDVQFTQQPPKPTSVPQSLWNHLGKTTNTFQLSAIEKIMSGKVKNSIALLQGPPGTGKTMTIVALVSALMNGGAPVAGAKAQGTKVHIGRAFSSNTGPVMNAVVPRRILVCAPSNQAVDELAWKIHKYALGPNGKPASFNTVRFGILPGEERHDGRGKRHNRRETAFHDNERDKFLSAINLDNLLRDIAGGKEVHDYAHGGDKQAAFRKKKGKSRYINYATEREKILTQCHVVCTTLSGAGSKAFIEAVSRDQFPQSEFDAVIIDEACQGSEMSCLIPFKFNPNMVCLVGDPNQLPVMTFSQDAPRCNADRSLFNRLQSNGWPVSMLRIQYRMHPAIVNFPSKTFYNSSLLTCEKVKTRRPALWHEHIAFPPYLVWNKNGDNMSRGPNGGISNNAEANFVVKLLQTFFDHFGNVMRNIDIGVISFYNDQISRIKNKLRDKNFVKRMSSNNVSIQVSTVDGFQGSEKDIIILSCVRSPWTGKNNSKVSIGFLKDFRRVNVALTRAKHSLWVVANCDTLQQDALWNDLIRDAHSRNLIARGSNLYAMTSGGHQKGKKEGGRKNESNKNRSRRKNYQEKG